MLKIHAADEENANYGRIRMFQALQYQKEIGELGEVTIPSEGTVRKIMEQIHLIHKPKRKPNGITKADREAHKSDDLLKRDFTADAPLQKCVTDITEIPAKDGKRLCEKISVNSTTVIKNDIVEWLEKQPLNFFTVYNKYRNLSSFFNSQSAGVERSGMEAD